jgi:hypothetical protein
MKPASEQAYPYFHRLAGGQYLHFVKQGQHTFGAYFLIK